MIPTNIKSLGAEEARLREKSLALINADAALLDHLAIIEAAMSAIYSHVNERPHRNADELTIQKLGIRLFNDLASALGQAFAGYYQQAFDTVRDVLEIQFLLDDFSGNRPQIERWASMTKRERDREFSPRAVRERLDARYGHTTQRRRLLYQRLSNLASHPSPEGFTMTAPDGDARIGPFLELRYLRGFLEEAAVQGLNATINFTALLPAQTDGECLAKKTFLRAGGPWLQKYLPNEVDDAVARRAGRAAPVVSEKL